MTARGERFDRIRPPRGRPYLRPDGARGEGERARGEGPAGEGSAGEGSAGEGSAGEGSAGEGARAEGSAGQWRYGEAADGVGAPGKGAPGEGAPGREGLFSAAGARVRGGLLGLTLHCSRCGRSTALDPGVALRAAVPLFLVLPWRDHPVFALCPACEQRSWLRVTGDGGRRP